MPETLGPSKHMEPEAFRNSLSESQGRGRQRDMDGSRQGGRERMQKKRTSLLLRNTGFGAAASSV